MSTIDGPANKSWWGPRIWRILHSLAEINDRTDVGPAWRQTLLLTAEVVPCQLCREHFLTHVRRMVFPIGVSNYATLRRALWTIHAGTVVAAEPFPEERLSTEYGAGGNREEVIVRVTQLLSEVVTAFQTYGVLDRLHSVSLSAWNRGMRQLINLLRYPQPAQSNGHCRGMVRRRL
jgi:hypothetical protein